jgi:sarcosine oxidase
MMHQAQGGVAGAETDSLKKDAFDVGVVGLGAMGAASLYELALRGLRAVGWERGDVLHSQGSSHGHSRIIRTAYAEEAGYVPLARRSFELWRRLEQDALRGSGVQLLHVTGGLDIGRPGSARFEGALDSCRRHGLAHEVLSGEEVNARFPGWQLSGEFRAVLQSDAGFLDPEACIASFLQGALARGASVLGREPVLGWRRRGAGFEVRTIKGAYQVRKLVLCTGAWTDKVVALSPSLAEALPPAARVTPERQVLGWFAPKPGRHELFVPSRFPIFILEDGAEWYGFPAYKVPGVKIGLFGHLHEEIDPDQPRREPDARDEAVLRRCLEVHCPDSCSSLLSMATCMFENSADHHFIMDSPQEGLFLCTGFSGHGFKFASAVGELVADWADGTERPDPHARFARERFSLQRLRAGSLARPAVHHANNAELLQLGKL